jgi:cysteine desulfurase
MPLFFGGSQQSSLRPGTENTPLAVSFGYAAQKASAVLAPNHEKVLMLNNRLRSNLNGISGIVINSPVKDCSPYILNVSLVGYRSETLLHFLEERNVFVSSGSACSKGAKSPVLSALGCRESVIDSALRISLSRYNTEYDIDTLCEALAAARLSLRRG